MKLTKLYWKSGVGRDVSAGDGKGDISWMSHALSSCKKPVEGVGHGEGVATLMDCGVPVNASGEAPLVVTAGREEERLNILVKGTVKRMSCD